MKAFLLCLAGRRIQAVKGAITCANLLAGHVVAAKGTSQQCTL